MLFARQSFIQNNEFNQIKSHKLAVSNFVDILGYGQLTQNSRSLRTRNEVKIIRFFYYSKIRLIDVTETIETIEMQ